MIDSGLRLASLNDIAAMKMAAIINRGTKKDFIDMSFLIDRITLPEILSLYEQKYHDGSRFIAIKCLTYFNDAEADPMPFMFSDISWQQIKDRISETVRKYII